MSPADTFPRQLARTLRFTLGAPRNLTVSPDGARVAKRHGAVTLRELLALGWTGAQVTGLLAASLLPGTPEGPVQASDLIVGWDLRRVPPDAVVLAVPERPSGGPTG